MVLLTQAQSWTWALSFCSLAPNRIENEIGNWRVNGCFPEITRNSLQNGQCLDSQGQSNNVQKRHALIWPRGHVCWVTTDRPRLLTRKNATGEKRQSFAWRKMGKPTFIWRETDNIWVSDRGLTEPYRKPTAARLHTKATEAEPRTKVISRNDWAPF